MEYQHIFGPVPSRRLGLSLGVSPIPDSTCNYSCIYCQLGRTRNMTNSREEHYPIKEIINEFKEFLKSNVKYDVVSIVGEGEPTLYSDLGNLIIELKKITEKPVVVITNGSLLSFDEVRRALLNADILLPSMDAFDEESFKKINRPYGKLKYEEVRKGLEIFSKDFKGELWLEIMLMKNINDSKEIIGKYKKILKTINYDRLYINTPVRPPAEEEIREIDKETMAYAAEELGGISIDLLSSQGFYSDIKDHKQAIKSIIKRHPMNQMELFSFITGRGLNNSEAELLIEDLKKDKEITLKEYKGYITFRLK